jgi:hypothetical protein
MLLDLLWGALALALPALLLLGPAADDTASVSDSQKLSTWEQPAAAQIHHTSTSHQVSAPGQVACSIGQRRNYSNTITPTQHKYNCW